MAVAASFGRKSVTNGKPKRKGKKRIMKEEEEAAAYESCGSWRRLPPDIATKILGLLTLHHVVNAQAVCKQWRAALLHGRCISHEAKGDMLSPLFVSSTWTGYYRKFSFCAYHAASHRWVRSTLSFLPLQSLAYIPPTRACSLWRPMQCPVSTSVTLPLNATGHCHRPLMIPMTSIWSTLVIACTGATAIFK
ncbi:hypothetical protein L7F22_063674 [Adiantum nelumboides]|nr:hypothetical protein [Adiantum nelumboides]